MVNQKHCTGISGEWLKELPEERVVELLDPAICCDFFFFFFPSKKTLQYLTLYS